MNKAQKFSTRLKVSNLETLILGCAFIAAGAFCSSNASAQIQTGINYSNSSPVSSFSTYTKAAKDIASNFKFNYFAKYLGPSLSEDYQEGATYNRFKTGQSVYSGEDLDHTASYQSFQAFTLGYKFRNGMALNYGVSYQDDVKENIQFSGGERVYGRSFNNHRVSLWVPQIYSNSLFSFSSTFYYEIPTTEGSKDLNMQYGIGFQPSLNFFSNISGLSYGLGASIERDVYPDNEYIDPRYITDWCRQNMDICILPKPEKMQVLRASVSPFISYALLNRLTFKGTLTFDWDQVGDQEGTTEFNANLDDIYSLSLSYLFGSSVVVSGGLEGSVNKPHIERTALFGSLGVSI